MHRGEKKTGRTYTKLLTLIDFWWYFVGDFYFLVFFCIFSLKHFGISMCTTNNTPKVSFNK